MNDNNIHSEEKNQTKKLFLKFRFIIALIFLLFISVTIVVALLINGSDPDPESEAKIREVIAETLRTEFKIQKDPNDLTDEDFAKINEIRFGQLSIYSYIDPLADYELADIHILAKCINLKTIRMENVNYTEKAIPKWMKLLAKLGVYDINKRYKIDLKPLSKIQTLELIQMNNVPIKNIKALGSLKNLKKLFLADNDISDLGVLRELKNLNALSLNGTNISDLEPLKDLVNLQNLSLDSTKISNLEPLRRLINLDTLIVSNTSVSDIEPLKELKNLQELELYNTKISDFEPLNNLINLKKLTIDGTQLSNLVKGLPELESLTLIKPDVENIEYLKEFTNIKHVSLIDSEKITDSQIEDIEKAIPDLNISRVLE